MIALSEHRVLRIVVLCTLYVAQGIPFGFFTVTLAASLAADGLSVDQIGKVFALGTIPWALKWIWGPFVDRFGSSRLGRRRPWILAAQTGMILTLVGLWSLPNPSSNLWILGGLILAHNVCNSLQDVCVDALAIDLLPPKDRGKASGLMYGSKYLGTAIGGAGLTFLMYVVGGGLSTGFAGMIALILLIGLFPLLTVERPGQSLTPWSKPLTYGLRSTCPHCGYDLRATSNVRCPECGGLIDADTAAVERATPRSVAETIRELRLAFSNRASLVTALVALLVTTASGLLAPVASVLFVGELGWSETEYGAATGGAAVFAGLAGSIGGGFIADLLGPRRVVATASILLAIVLTTFGLQLESIAEASRSVLWIYLIVEAALLGCLNAAFFAVCFGVCRPAVAATQFTAYMAMANLGVAGAQAMAGRTEVAIGLMGMWLLGAAIQGVVALLIPLTSISADKNPAENA